MHIVKRLLANNELSLKSSLINVEPGIAYVIKEPLFFNEPVICKQEKNKFHLKEEYIKKIDHRTM